MTLLEHIRRRGLAYKKYAPKVMRLTLFVLFVYAGVVVFVYQRARAQMGEMLFALGVEMLRYDDVEKQGETRTLHLNGQEIHLATAVTRHPLERVLDYYESRCMEHDGRLAEQITELSRGDAVPGEIDGSMFDATLRSEEGNKGYVACLDQGTERASPDGVIEKFERFKATLDISEMGALRYIYAEESDGTTLFVTFWSDGPLRIREIFPSEGDAPGRDVEGVPRPDGSRRILSSWEAGEPQIVAMYQSGEAEVRDIDSFYRRSMEDGGWTLLELDEERRRALGFEVPRTPNPFLVFEQDERMVAVGISQADSQGPVTTVLGLR
jgi:hypothetical protein